MINKILNILLLMSIILTYGCSNEKQNTSNIKEDGSTPNQQEEINENKDETSIGTLMPETEKNEVIDNSDESVIHWIFHNIYRKRIIIVLLPVYKALWLITGYMQHKMS